MRTSWTWTVALVGTMAGAATVATAPKDGGPPDVVLRGVAIVDVMAGRVMRDQDIVVQGTRIAEVRPAAPLPQPAKATVEGAGKFVIPGLVDAGAAGAGLTDGRAAQALLGWGVMAMDVPGLDGDARRRWQRDLNSGRAYGPRLVAACGPPRGVAAASSAAAPMAVHDALQRLVDGGRTHAAALRTFTRDNAAGLCLESDGVIAPGRPADLMVLAGNPLTDIRHTRAIDAVVFRGELLSQAHVRMLRRGALAPPTPAATR